MNADRKTILMADAAGGVCWDEVTGETWRGRDTSFLYRTGRGHWARLDLTDELVGKPARLLSDEEALTWLLANGHAVPEALAGLATSWRVKPAAVQSSKRPRRRKRRHRAARRALAERQTPTSPQVRDGTPARGYP